MKEKIIEINHLSKNFGNHEVLKDINFSVTKGDVTSIIGASGSGKSTLLRCINLLETPTSGEILYNSNNILNTKNIPKYRAKVGMVFQNFNLFENMNVLKNCMIGLQKVLKIDRQTAKEKSLLYLQKVGMSAYVNAKPSQLSGGQKQRVAIARALAMQPDVLLFDEPTSALDPATINDFILLLNELSKTTTIVIVSHEMDLIKSFADKVLFLKNGSILEYGTSDEILNSKNEEVRKFLGK